MDLLDPLSLPIITVHRSKGVFKAIPCIGTELAYIGSSWPFYLCSFIWRSPQEHIAYEFVLTSPAVSRMSGSSNLDSFRDGWLVAVQLLFCRVLLPRLVRYCSQHCCVFAVNLFIRLVSVHVVHPYSSINTTATWKKQRFILSARSDFHMTNKLSIAIHGFASLALMSFSIDETPLPWWVNLSTSFKGSPFSVEMSTLWLKHMYSVLSALTWSPMPAAARSRLCRRILAWAGGFARSTVIDVVCVHNCSCGVSSASFLCQLETVFFHQVNKRSKLVVKADDK